MARGNRLLAVLVAGVGPMVAPRATLGQEDPRIDPETGASQAHYPPARHFDHLHMRLALDIPDMGEQHLTARQTLTLTPLGRARDRLRLDAVGLQIRDVRLEGRSQAFEHDGKDLVVLFDRPIRPAERVDVEIDYAGEFPYATGAGLTWTLGNPDSASLTDRSPQIHTQGQPESSSLWFPCHDFPNERLTTELIVTVDSDYQVCANGALAGREAAGDGRARWRWVQDSPHPNYLVVLVVGRFALVGLGGDAWDRPDLPLTVYAPVGFATRMAEAFEATPRMIEHFEERFDEPFPWAKYAQLIVRRFSAGAMENTSATTFNQGLAMTGEIDGVIAHELVHQWMGDLVGYRSWEHLWLGEGWATYGEALWAEHDAPEGESRDAYHRTIYGHLSATRTNSTYAPLYPGLASKLYASPDQNFFKPNNPYTKGSLVLHMLRMRLGDETFFGAVAEFIDRHRLESVETDDFRRVLEEASGQSLERFFRQWVRQPGMPRVDLELAWDAAAGALRVRAEQTQRIDADNPAYAFVLPLYAEFAGGGGRYLYLPMETRSVERSFELPAPPEDVSVDPNLRVATHTKVSKDLAMWLHELERGPTLLARARAAEHLAGVDDDRARDALARAGAEEPLIEAIADAFAGEGLETSLAGEEQR